MRQIAWSEANQNWPILEPIDGCRERPIALNKKVCVAGDRVRVNLTLPAETVSRAHAIFVTDSHGIYLRDLASLNHVFINEEAVRESALHQGDVLRIGPYAFRCQGGAASKADADSAGKCAPAAELRTPDNSIHMPLDGRRTTLLGSRDDCDVKMAGAKVSPAHAIIFAIDDQRYIRDLRSMSGTYINEKKVGQTQLNPGDEIRVGDSTLIYQAAASTDADGTLAGVLAEEEAHQQASAAAGIPLMPEAASEQREPIEVQQSPAPAPPPDDLDVIPLLDESEDLPSLAREYAEEKDDAAAAEPAGAHLEPSDSGIIPLMDDSFGGGIGGLNSADPMKESSPNSGIPLLDESSGSAMAADVALPGTLSRAGEGSERRGNSSRKQKSRDEQKSGRRSGTRNAAK